MTDLFVKRHDTWPPLSATLKDEDGPIDLTAATKVLVLMKGTSVLVDGTCTFATDRTTGVVTYAWASGDTAVSGDYRTEFEITWNTGKIETVPNATYATITIVDDLGP